MGSREPVHVRRIEGVSMKDIPAFPVFPETGGGHASAFRGMTLRDYFAAKAMQGMITRRVLNDYEDALIAYKMADAMMKAREA